MFARSEATSKTACENDGMNYFEILKKVQETFVLRMKIQFCTLNQGVKY